MGVIPFQKPDKVLTIEESNNYGCFEFKPLEPGYGVTIGNSLRRVLLSSLEGYAITKIKINDVLHEFSTIPGIVEDVSEIILNLKQVRFKKHIEDIESEIVNISIIGQTEFKAKDINKFTSNFTVVNDDLTICHLNPDVRLNLTLWINKGRGYVTAEENKSPNDPIGIIPIDSIFTPIKNVKYTVENYRIEQKTDYEKLILEITTDGTISPKETLKEASKILIYHYMIISEDKFSYEIETKEEKQEFDEEYLKIRQLLKNKIENYNLTSRSLNCLKSIGINTLGDLVQYSKEDLLKLRNFGKKSLLEIEELLSNLGLSLSMDISKYKLDKG